MSEELKEVPFITGCPILSCPRSKNKDDPCHWTHNECGLYETINDQGIIYCNGCGSLGCFIQLEYKCRLHDNYYSPKSIQEFSAMLSILSDLPGVSRAFTKKLLKIVYEKC